MKRSEIDQTNACREVDILEDIKDEAKVNWSLALDKKLAEIVEKNSGRNWKKVAKEMNQNFKNPSFTAKKCRERWCNCINPEFNKGSLTEAEELLLVIYHSANKNQWALISKYIPQRSNNMLKNNFSSLIRKICRKASLMEICSELSSSMFVQELYACLILYELTQSTDSEYCSANIAPLHLQSTVKRKRLIPENLLNYIHNVINCFASENDDLSLSAFASVMSFKKLAELIKIIEKEVLRVMPSPSLFSEEKLRYVLNVAGSQGSQREKKLTPASPASGIFSREFETMNTPDVFSPCCFIPFKPVNKSLALPLPAFHNKKLKEDSSEEKIPYSLFFAPKPAPQVVVPLPSRPSVSNYACKFPRQQVKSQFLQSPQPAAYIANKL